MIGESSRTLKSRLLEGEQLLTCFLLTGSPVVAEIVAAAGYPTVMVDCEHGPGGLETAIHQMRAIEGAGAAALIRVESGDRNVLKRALDAGPGAIMVPQIENGAQASAVVSSCRYPPRGTRGVAHPAVRASAYGCGLPDYLDEFDARFLLICQIETRSGVDNAAEIAATDGVDMIFIGPMDLSASLGHFNEPDHPEVLEAIASVESATKAAGKMLGGLTTSGRSARTLFDLGYSLAFNATDARLLAEGAKAALKSASGGY